jgi:hypothetical protein
MSINNKAPATKAPATTDNYPYYRRIPLKDISDKQEIFIESLKDLNKEMKKAKEAEKPEEAKEAEKPEEAKKQPIHPPQKTQQEPQPHLQQLQTYTIPYSMLMSEINHTLSKEYEKKQKEIHDNIIINNDILNKHSQLIRKNELLIQQQNQEINKLIIKITDNTNVIQQQNIGITHNNNTLNYQAQQIIIQETQLEKYRIELQSLQEQIMCYNNIIAACNSVTN